MNLIYPIFFSILLLNPNLEPERNEFKIYVFFGENCPICQFYTKKVKEISGKHPSFEIVYVFPNILSSVESVKKFQKKYKTDFGFILDSNLVWTNKFNAEITPEVFVYHEQQDSVYYSGRIDDYYYKLGKRRAKVQSDDLLNAIKEIENKEKVKTVKTNSVGCFISKNR